MSDILSMLQGVLQEGGYHTWLTPIEKRTAVCFEDDSVMGFAMVFDDSSTLLGAWRSAETAFLVKHAERIRLAGDKAWNVYAVFLTDAVSAAGDIREIRSIEEDLERTRKIGASGVGQREALVAALLPLLPLQQRPVLDQEDVAARLRRRVLAIAPSAAEIVLDDSVSPKDVARRLSSEK